MSILELLHHIVNEPAPRLVSRSREFPASATSFIENCLDKEPSNRKSPQELLVSASKLYISKLTRTDLGLGGFRQSFCRRYPGMGKEDGCCRGGVMGDQSVFRVLTLICICLFIRLVTIMYFMCSLMVNVVWNPLRRKCLLDADDSCANQTKTNAVKLEHTPQILHSEKSSC
jgi:hypothetical protein